MVLAHSLSMMTVLRVRGASGSFAFLPTETAYKKLDSTTSTPKCAKVSLSAYLGQTGRAKDPEEDGITLSLTTKGLNALFMR
jgi:hypothetical protein